MHATSHNSVHAQCALQAPFLRIHNCVLCSSIFFNRSRRMDGGTFYTSQGHYGLPGVPSSFVSPLQQRRRSHSIPDHTGYDPPVPVAANVGIN